MPQSPDSAPSSESVAKSDDREKAHDIIHKPEENGPTNTAPAPAAPPPPPNGGYGWVCTACCFLINAHTWGINSSYGVFLAHYLTAAVFPGATYLEYAFVGSLSIGTALLVSPLATTVTRERGTRTTLLIGTALETAALVGASFASRVWHLFLSQGVCFGLGMGFLFTASVPVVAQWFTTRRSFANGLAAAGSGFGGLAYSLATAAMLARLGLPTTFRVLAALACGVNAVCALLLRDRNAALGAAQGAFDTQLLRRPECALFLLFGAFSMLAYVALLFSLADYAAAVGLTTARASVVSALLNLGQGLGRPPIGLFSDAVGRVNTALLMTALAGALALAAWIPAVAFGPLVFFALAGGAVAGTFWAVVGPVTAEVVGLRGVPAALNVVWLVLAVPCIVSEPIALEIVNFDGGSYRGAQVFVGCMYLAAATCLLGVRGWKIGEMDAVGLGVDAVGVDDADEEVRERARKEGRKRMLYDACRWRRV